MYLLLLHEVRISAFPQDREIVGTGRFDTQFYITHLGHSPCNKTKL